MIQLTKRKIIVALLVFFVLGIVSFLPRSHAQEASASFFPFNSTTVTVDFNSNGPGSNVDTIAFWEAPIPSDSLMFVSAKSKPLVEVWKYPFTSSLPALQHSCITTSNGLFVDQDTDTLYVSVPYSKNVCVFSLPDLTYLKTITSYNETTYGIEPNLTMLSSVSAAKKLYVSNDRTVDIYPVDTGVVTRFTPTKGLETMWGDNYYQLLYIPDENGKTGVYVYNPDGTIHTRNGVSKFGNNTIFNSDEEGITVYACLGNDLADNGSGLIIVSDQITSSTTGNDYEVFDRQTWAYLGKIKLKLATGKFVYNTDGIASTQQNSSAYPLGLFTAIQNDSSAVGVSWLKIFNEISAVSGRQFGCSSDATYPTPTAVATPYPTPTTIPPTPTTVITPTPTVVPGSTVTLSPIDDAHVSSGSPTRNYGTAALIIASNYSSSNIRIAYLKFNLSSLAGKIITNAKLVLTPSLARKVEKTVMLVDSNSWTQSAINWNNKPEVGSAIGFMPSQNVSIGVPVEINLNSSVVQSTAGDYLSIALDNTPLASTLEFYSGESATNKPVLVITTTTE